MRIVIDMQGAQTESRFRGIGRYSLSLALAITRIRDQHEVLLALNGAFPETIDIIRSAFDELLPQDNIRVWHAPGPVRESDPSNQQRRQVAERIREAFLLDLGPDVVLITSLFEGMGDDAVTSTGVWDSSIPTAVVLYDLIPLINPDVNFRTNKVYQDWYTGKIDSLRRCKLLLAISESSRKEALSALDADDNEVINISGACETSFQDLRFSSAEKVNARRKAGIDKPFVMYTGGADDRKNLPRLIEAFSRLPSALRSNYQLALIGKMPQPHIDGLRAGAAQLGLSDELVFTGYVSDVDLLHLYNSCELFVFPSLHEGLGLPPLEAMACGAPVIAANVTSLPEVVGNPGALFDPTSVHSIASKLEQVLTDEEFRARLTTHGRAHCKKFTWEESAKRTIEALSRFAPQGEPNGDDGLRFEYTSMFQRFHHRILIQKLDHRGDFILALPAIAKLRARYPKASIDVLVGSWNVQIAQETNLFDKVHVLDFYRSSSAHAPSLTNDEVEALAKRVGRYDLAIDLRRQSDTRFVLTRVDAALRAGYETFDPMIDVLLDVRLPVFPDVPFESTPLNKTHASLQMLRLVDALPPAMSDFIDLPDFSIKPQRKARRIALFPTAGNAVKQWAEGNFVELAERLMQREDIDRIDVYFGSAKEADSFHLPHHPKISTLVGLDFKNLIASLSQCCVSVANNSFGAHIAGYLGCTVVGVYGGHETVAEWAPPFGESYVLHTGAHCSPCHIAAKNDCPYAMECLSSIPVQSVFEKVLLACSGALKASNAESSTPSPPRTSSAIVDRLLQDIGALNGGATNRREKVAIAECVSSNHRIVSKKRQLLVDVSELVLHDARSGIQRVVRAVLTQLLQEPPEGFVVEPVYATADAVGYRYARDFRQHFVGAEHLPSRENPLADAWPGDVFLGLDLNAVVVATQKDFLGSWRRQGIKVCFVAYDLLPVMLPDAFPEGASAAHQHWLDLVARFDGVITISRAVADDFVGWLKYYGPIRGTALRVGWFHLGSDLATTAPTKGLPARAEQQLRTFKSRPSFLMVGTVEPRKSHALVLSAFESLWHAGVAANLVIVGKPGWLVDELVTRLHQHTELGKQLFWLQGVSDEYLEQIYASCRALIAASEGEGFGLPLVEAAQHSLPIIARDIPVFREVAGESAYYFPADSTAKLLADHIVSWLQLHQRGDHPRSESLRSITWKQSTQQMLGCALDDQWSIRWKHDGIHRFKGADPRLHSAMGERRGSEIWSTGRSGNLVFGPYVDLAPGTYRAKLWGSVNQGSGRNWFDIAHDLGRNEILQCDLGRLDGSSWAQEALFSVDNPIRSLEVRLWVGEGSIISLAGLEIAPVIERVRSSSFEGFDG